MAFYQKPQRRSWRDQSNEEEGSRYRGQYARKRGQSGETYGENTEERGNRFSKPSNNRSSYKGKPGFSGNAGNNRKPFGPNRSGKGRGNDRPRPSGHPYDRKFARPEGPSPEAEKSYREFEHVPAVPPKEENLPADNLLVGRNPIREALRSGRDLEKLLVARGELQGSAREILQMAKDAHVNIQEVDKNRLDEIAPHHQGMVAYASAYAYATVQEMLDVAAARGEDPFLVILDGVTDPHNLGAVIRSAECAGAHGVIVPARRSVGLTPAAVKASAGAIEHMKVARVSNLSRTLEELKRQGMWVYAVTMEGKDYRKIDFRGPCVLVVGSEGEGISRLVLENSDVQVSLPMKGHIDSLNASVAAGIMMYRVLESRHA